MDYDCQRCFRVLDPTARRIAAGFLVASLLAFAGCGGDSGSRDATTSVERLGVRETPAPAGPSADTGTLRPAGGQSVPPLWYAESLRTMVEFYDTIIVGQVTGVSEVRHPVRGQPDGSLLELPPETVFSVKVDRVLSAPRVRDGDTISLVQAGGPTKDGQPFRLEGDPLVDVGQTYVMFMNDLLFPMKLDLFSGPAFGRFVVANGIVMPNGWDGELGVGAVSGVTREEVLTARYSENPGEALAALARTSVDEAVEKILAAIAEAPLPPPQTPYPTTAPSEPAAH